MSAPFSRYRERTLPMGKPMKAGTKLGTLKSYNASSGSLLTSQDLLSTGDNDAKKFEKCWDQNNQASTGKTRNARGSRVFRTGGPFVSMRIQGPSPEIQFKGVYTKVQSGTKWEYTGGFSNPYIGADTVPPQLYVEGGSRVLNGNPLITDTTALESRAFDIMPKVEKMSIVNALYEFKDVPGQLRQTARAFKDIYKDMTRGDYKRHRYMADRYAGDYLNVQFGWIPFCRDIASMADYALFSRQYLADLVAGNNTWIKRKGTLVDTVVREKLFRGYTNGCEPQGSLIQKVCTLHTIDGQFCYGDCEIWAETEVHAWAEGAFKYYRPEFDINLPYYGSVVGTVSRELTASGFRLTPTHVWKAIPWSWCIDWFSNVGSIIERADAIYNDSMVTKYLYLMHHTVKKLTTYSRIHFASGTKTFEFTRFIDVKQRRSADSPYGFVLGGELSPTQWSILAALGLSKNVKFARSF